MTLKDGSPTAAADRARDQASGEYHAGSATTGTLVVQESASFRGGDVAWCAAVADALAREGDASTVFPQVCDALVEHLGVSSAELWIFDRPSQSLSRQGAAGAPMNRAGTVALGSGFVGRAALRGSATERDASGHTHHGVAMRVAGLVVGALAVYAPHDIDAQSVDALATVAGLVASVVERWRIAAVRTQESHLLERVVAGAQLAEVLERITRIVEEELVGARCTILLLDRDGTRLRTAAAPTIPAAYSAAIDGTEIGPDVGSCGSAAWHGEMVVASDIATDPRWAPFRDVALAHGLRACWSVPIRGAATGSAQRGQVLGTFAVYRAVPDAPSPHDVAVVDRATRLAGIAIARENSTRALRESEERYRQLLELLPSAVLLLGGAVIEYANAACVRLVGASHMAQLIGRPLRDFIPDETGDADERRLVRLDGVSVPVHMLTTPAADARKPATLVVLHDLSAQRRSDDLLRAVMRSVPDAIITVDAAHGTVESANPAVESLFGYAPSELVGQPVTVLVPECDRAREAALLVTPQHGARELTCARRTGETFPAELTVTTFRLGSATLSTGVFRDITARRRLEENLAHAQKLEAVGQLAGGIAHDFNNLLTVINGATEILLMDGPDEPSREQLTQIRAAGDRAASLTGQLLAYSRRQTTSPREVDLNRVVRHVEPMLRRIIGEDVAVLTDLAPHLAAVRVDPNQVELMLMNLATNARDAMPSGGSITFRSGEAVCDSALPCGHALAAGRYVRLDVSDTGEGMPDDVKARVFEPFFTTKGVGHGTGLGLAIAHSVVTQAGGHICVESHPARGTTFSIFFPAAVRAPIASSRPPPPDRAAQRGTETVLVVEDEDAVRRIARVALEDHGYSVLEARSARQALAVARMLPQLDLVLTDVVMPEMGGRALADALRERWPELRVLFMSGYTRDAIARHGVHDGSDPFLAKPFTPSSLLAKVRAVLDVARAAHETR